MNSRCSAVNSRCSATNSNPRGWQDLIQPCPRVTVPAKPEAPGRCDTYTMPFPQRVHSGSICSPDMAPPSFDTGDLTFRGLLSLSSFSPAKNLKQTQIENSSSWGFFFFFFFFFPLYFPPLRSQMSLCVSQQNPQFACKEVKSKQ